MTQLYTVRMKRKQIVSIFNARGKKVREDHRLIDLIYTDLPYQTAMMYKTTCPDSHVTVEHQTPGYEPKSKAKHRIITTGVAEYSPRRKSTEKPEAKAELDDAPAHDYAALVNTMVKESVE